MAKNVFRSQEVVLKGDRVYIEPPAKKEVVQETVEQEEIYTGPSLEDLRREAEMFQKNFEAEKASMMAGAKEEADAIIRAAEEKAFEEVKKKTDEAARIKREAEEEAARVLEEALKEAQERVEESQKQAKFLEDESRNKGYESGREEGFQSGKQEVERLTEVLHSIVNKAIEKRAEILQESETQLINLVLQISRKVIKVISENQKNVVINNVVQALRKLRSRGDVIIRVNLLDVELTSEHIKEFVRMVENVRSITVLEDSSVDRGGCIIETDFGEIDARIASQLHEIEEKIIELIPIKTKEK